MLSFTLIVFASKTKMKAIKTNAFCSLFEKEGGSFSSLLCQTKEILYGFCRKNWNSQKVRQRHSAVVVVARQLVVEEELMQYVVKHNFS